MIQLQNTSTQNSVGILVFLESCWKPRTNSSQGQFFLNVSVNYLNLHVGQHFVETKPAADKLTHQWEKIKECVFI